MRRALRLAALFVCVVVIGFGADPALVTHTTASAVAGGTATTSAIDTSGANFIGICVADFGVDSAADMISDSKVNTWSHVTSHTFGGNRSTTLFFSVNPTVGTGHTFSGVGGYIAMMVSSWSNVATTSPLDQQNGNTGSGVSTLTTGSVTPTVNKELLLACISTGNSVLASIDNGFTITDLVTNGTSENGGSAYLVQTTAGAINPQWSLSVAGDSAAVIGTFKPNTGGGTTSNTPAHSSTL